jgi:transposase
VRRGLWFNAAPKPSVTNLRRRFSTVLVRQSNASAILRSGQAGQIAEAFGCHARTVENVRRRFVTDGTAAALERKKRDHPPREKVLDGEAEAHLIAVACSEPPEGRARWTLELLADKLVELNIVESVSYQTVRFGGR